MFLLVFVLGSSANVRGGTMVAIAESAGLSSGLRSPLENRFTPLAMDLKLLFFGVGLIGWGFVALVLLG